MIKKADVLLSVGLVLLSLLGLLLLPGGGQERRVTIKQEGRVVYSGPLSVDKTFTLEGAYTNVIEIRGGAAYYADSDCPGQDCVHMGRISEAGRVAACAPNHTILLIQGGDGEVDGIAE